MSASASKSPLHVTESPGVIESALGRVRGLPISFLSCGTSTPLREPTHPADAHGRMKDSDGPSSTNYDSDDQPRRCLPSTATNGDLRLSNGSPATAAMAPRCRRRRAASGPDQQDACSNGVATTDYGLLVTTAPRVEQVRAQPVSPAPAAGNGFLPVDETDTGGWAAVPTRAQILRDVANLCTFTGAILATLAMACMWKGRYAADAVSLLHILRSVSSYLERR